MWVYTYAKLLYTKRICRYPATIKYHLRLRNDFDVMLSLVRRNQNGRHQCSLTNELFFKTNDLVRCSRWCVPVSPNWYRPVASSGPGITTVNCWCFTIYSRLLHPNKRLWPCNSLGKRKTKHMWTLPYTVAVTQVRHSEHNLSCSSQINIGRSG